MSIHHIEVNHVATRSLSFLHLLAEPGEVRRKD
jgi:hypothetical protein